jgi:hypothetical protein
MGLLGKCAVIGSVVLGFSALEVQGAVIIGTPITSRATLIYNAGTGDLKIDPNGNTIRSFDLYSHVVPTPSSPGDTFFNDTVTAFPGVAMITTDNYYEKFWLANSSTYYITKVVDLGNICPTGLTETQFATVLSYSDVTFDTHWGKPGGGTYDFNLTYVPAATPEPSSLGLMALGGLALIRRRKA